MKKNAKPVEVEGDDNEETEELEESDEEKPKRKFQKGHYATQKERSRVTDYRKRKREEMGEAAYKEMINRKNREYKARKRNEARMEEERRLATLEERHP